MSSDHHTAALRSATGLDQGARALILGIVIELTDYEPDNILSALFRDRYGMLTDYYAAVREVHGDNVAYRLERVAADAQTAAEVSIDLRRPDPIVALSRALLLEMPAADFRLAVEDALRFAGRIGDAAPRITKVCRTRGVPWVFEAKEGFQWVGDAEVERGLIEPALSAVNDPRFGSGVHSEFKAARAELRLETPAARKQAIYEAGCAVESAMKVVLDSHKLSYDKRATAHSLFNALEEAGLVPRRLEKLVLAASTPRNQTAGHGAGAVAHDPSPAEAESVVAAAAGAIAYLHSCLPDARQARGFLRRRR